MFVKVFSWWGGGDMEDVKVKMKQDFCMTQMQGSHLTMSGGMEIVNMS